MAIEQLSGIVQHYSPTRYEKKFTPFSPSSSNPNSHHVLRCRCMAFTHLCTLIPFVVLIPLMLRIVYCKSRCVWIYLAGCPDDSIEKSVLFCVDYE